MTVSVWWSLERGIFFVGAWMYYTLFGIDLWNWFAAYKSSINKINAIYLKSQALDSDGTSQTVHFITYWSILAAIATILFYISKLKYSGYKKLARKSKHSTDQNDIQLEIEIETEV